MRNAGSGCLLLSALVMQGCAVREPEPDPAADPTVMNPVVEAAAVVSETTMDGRRGRSHGILSFEDGPFGLIIKPKLRSMDPGPHALHVHENPSCEPDDAGVPAGAAGGHYDPAGTGVHRGPYQEGHLGDLPNLMAEPNGMVTLPVLAPRLTVADLKGKSVMVHAGADRYDKYAEHEHGKGGMRMFCGLIR